MKKLILTSLLTLALAPSASAAVPSGGVYLDKDGTPLHGSAAGPAVA